MKDLNLNIRINYLVLKNVHQCLFATPNLCITKFNMLNSAVSFFLSQHLGVIFILYRYIILKVSYYYSFQSPDYYLIWQHTWRNNETVNEKLTRRSNVFSIEFTKTSFFLTTMVEYTIPVTRLQNLISYTLFFLRGWNPLLAGTNLFTQHLTVWKIILYALIFLSSFFKEILGGLF